ncbi:O-antigen ligase family protein [Serratia sp. D1N4]
MISLSNPFRPKKLYVMFFFLFSFFSAIFCGFTKVNNLFHLSAIFFIITLYLDKDLRLSFFRNRESRQGLALIAAMLLYFSFSNLWSSEPFNIESTLTHSVYLLLYLAMLITVLNSQQRNLLFSIIVLGLTILCLYSIFFDYNDILTNRLVSKNNPGPDNVIDLAGLAGVGVILSLIVFREKQSKFMLLAVLILFGTMLLTQSRGPVLSLLIALILTLPYKHLKLKHLTYFLFMLIAMGIAILFTEIGQQLIARFEGIYVQSFLRLSIWHHTFDLVKQAPYFGYGFNYELDFTNYSGEHISTTHSLYWGTLLKGGMVGLGMLVAILSYCGILATRHLRNGMRLEVGLFIFTLLFYTSQGMFMIGNPAEFWYLFWFPLGVLMTTNLNSRVY